MQLFIVRLSHSSVFTDDAHITIQYCPLAVALASMDEFYRDALRFGCLQGFKHFSLYLRGREELLVTVFHGDDGARGGAEATMDTICESNASGGATGTLCPPRR